MDSTSSIEGNRIPQAVSGDQLMSGGRVVAHIYGGLGNQMFQYACGRALALRNGADFQIDDREFTAGPGQLFSLHHFNIVRQSGAAGTLPPTKKERVRYLIWRYFKGTPKFTREKGTAFDPDILKLKGDICLHGYWQSERYFEDFSDRIRDELTIITSPDEKNRRVLEEIQNCQAVSVHVRRGDYVSNPKARAYHGLCGPEYYQAAARFIAGKLACDPVFYIFSDEPDWARAHLELPFETRIPGHNDSEHNYEDMRLMAACRHHIIANSSFSWWGAWLNPSPDKIVIAPAQWVANAASENPHITPESWLRMEG